MDPRQIFINLLDGYYIRKRASLKSVGYCLYHGKMNPVVALSDTDWKAISKLTKCKNGKYTIDKRQIWKLHGNNWFKKHYKSLKK